MRYSAASGDPNNFKNNGPTLRQVHCDPFRRTELSIIVTIYNETNNLFTSVMYSVMKISVYLGRHWGRDDWTKVSDGCQKINSRALSVVRYMNAYQQDIATELCGGIYM